jgi:glycerol-3-phosphate dehydrogenase
MNRRTALERLRTQRGPFDLVIVGGGATGLGTAVDAASRGYSVCLVEQSDFAKGTSSRSTKLVHGGVRYLKQGNISLVMEALHERGRLHQNAPHLVHSLPFVIPTYHWWEGPFYGVGMKVYDQLAGSLGLSPSRILNKAETLERIPTIEQEHLTGGVIYHDGQFDDARLAVTLAQTASKLGAVVINYMACTGLLKAGGKVSGITARDAETGDDLEIEGRCVVNATGVFVDELRRHDEAGAKGIVAFSQGVHMVLPREFLPGDSAIMIPKTEDGRVLFAVPWHDRVVVGTTDTPVPGAELEPRALPEEREFLMQHAARYLTRDPQPEDVLSIYSGLRPLVKHGEGKRTASLSRDHTILMSESGLLTVTGGKWTTYRKMAEDVVDHAHQHASLAKRRCETETLQLHGWTRAVPANEALRVYGSDAADIEALCEGRSELRELVHPELTLSKAEIVWHVRHEMACCVEDVLARRSRGLLLHARAAMQAAPVVAKQMALELGRDQGWTDEQVRHFAALAGGYLFA